MRKLAVAGFLIAVLSRTVAADDPTLIRPQVYYGPPPTVQLYTWSGLYVGGHIGGGWVDTAGSDENGSFIGGAQVGFNVRAGGTVWGLEAQWTGVGSGGDDDNGRSLVTFPGGVTGTFESDIEWVATLTARAGIAWDRSLFYVKGGAAWARNTYDGFLASTPGSFSGSETRTGWAVGLGYEYAFRNAWSVRLDYTFMDFGSDTVTLSGPASTLVVPDVDSQVHALTFSVNYRFDWPTGPLGTPD